ncbi:hypothetical protein BDN71DRAFT_1445939, partial [Pleurotus eryngii]
MVLKAVARSVLMAAPALTVVLVVGPTLMVVQILMAPSRPAPICPFLGVQKDPNGQTVQSQQFSHLSFQLHRSFNQACRDQSLMPLLIRRSHHLLCRPNLAHLQARLKRLRPE